MPINHYSDHLIQPTSLPFENVKMSHCRRQQYPCQDPNDRGNFIQPNNGSYNSSNSGNYADIPHSGGEYSNSDRENFISRENNCYERSAQMNFNGCNNQNIGNFVSHPNLDMQRGIPNHEHHNRSNFSNPNLDNRGYYPNKTNTHHGNFGNHYSDSSVMDMNTKNNHAPDGFRKENRNCGINLRDILPSPPEQPYGSCGDYRLI